MASSSDDDVPLANRKPTAPNSGGGSKGKASKPRNPKLQIPGKAQASVKRKATKPSVIDDATDSEDEPLTKAMKQPAGVKAGPAHGSDYDQSSASWKRAKKMPSKPKPPAGSNSDTSKEATPKPKAPRSKATPHVKPKPQPRAAKGKENEEKPKKKFELPGQTRDTPEENDPLRKFYTSLYEQSNGRSEMATKWMLQTGLFDFETASATVERMKAGKSATGSVKRQASQSPAVNKKPKH